MQKYKCHKVVEAMKIEEINFDVSDAPFLAGDGGPIQPRSGYFGKHIPQAGGKVAGEVNISFTLPKICFIIRLNNWIAGDKGH